MDLVSVPTLAEAVRERSPGAPLDRIEAALAVSDHLLSGADELIGLFVAEARAAGCSWTEIGQRIGVSKQAARQRFIQAPALTLASGLELRPRLIACLAAAAREASADGSAEIGTHHQLIGLFQEGVAAAILEKLGARADMVRRAARELFPGEDQPAERPPEPGTPREPGGPRESGMPPESGAPRESWAPPPDSAEAHAAVQGAAALARRGHCDYVGTEHLLGALALDPGSRARRVLINLGISIPGIKRELECYISPRMRRRRGRGKTAEAACSFCGKPRDPGLRLVAGPGVYICAECVRLCNEIIADEAAGPEGGGRPGPPAMLP